jgi:GT2 family glycosyltransferase
MKKLLYVVIPNWNGADLLAGCLNSLKNQTFEHKVIVVDNGSVDNSVELLEKDFPEVILLKNPKNLGFAGGVNTGIRYALENNADYIALFNNDALAEPDWLEKLVNAMEADDKIGITTCKLMRDDKKHFDSTGDFYSTWGMPFPRDRNREDTGQRDAKESVFGATGGASLYRADMLREIGIFDETFFAYYEDVDISFRARLAGWDIIYEPSSVVYHQVSATSSKHGNLSRLHSTKNFFILYVKNMPLSLFFKYLPFFIYQAIRLAGSSTLKGKPHIWLKGFLMFLIKLPVVLKNRWEIQKSRKISPQKIDKLLYKGRPPQIPSI